MPPFLSVPYSLLTSPCTAGRPCTLSENCTVAESVVTILNTPILTRNFSIETPNLRYVSRCKKSTFITIRGVSFRLLRPLLLCAKSRIFCDVTSHRATVCTAERSACMTHRIQQNSRKLCSRYHTV